MLATAKKNLRFLKRYLENSYLTLEEKFAQQFFKGHDRLRIHEHHQKTINPSNLHREHTVTPTKQIFVFALKSILLITLINWLLISPIRNSISNATEAFNKNNLIKIISLDFISNPLTFVRMAEFYLGQQKYEQAALFTEYAKTLLATHTYPKEITRRIEALESQLSKVSVKP
jgi:hypothetical protein